MKRKVETEFVIDDLRAVKIGGLLFDLFNNRQGFFEDYSMPEYILPRNLVEGSREHALFLTYVISIDYMTDAEKLWKRSREAYELSPDRFELERIVKFGSSTVQSFVKGIGARFSPSAAKTWIKISEVLLEHYNGDPREIASKPVPIHEIKQQLQKFPYLKGPKLSNFYIRVMGETGLFQITDLDELDIPVDKQVARFTIYTGVLRLLAEQFIGCAQDEPLRGLIEEAWRHAAQALGIAPWKLDEPIWTIGSKLCSGRKCTKCPIDNLCNHTRGVTFKENTVFWKVGSSQPDKKPSMKRTGMMTKHEFVVFEDLASATNPKLHSTNCGYYKNWLAKPTQTTRWHGPYKSKKRAWALCKEIALKTDFEPSEHDCMK